MRIDPNSASVSQTALESAKPQGEGARRVRSTATPEATSAASVVTLSSAASAASADAPSATITARLDRIRAMLDAGDYPVDLDQLAARIVDDDLLRAGSRS
jgi:anti-sigma28 factor (negative regulator of flagellin synthesis)